MQTDREKLLAARAANATLDRLLQEVTADRNALRAEMLATAAWLEERAGCAERIAEAGKRLSRVGAPARAEAARLRGRAELLRHVAGMSAGEE